MLSKKQISIRNLQKIPMFIIGLILSMVFIFLIMLRASAKILYLGDEQGSLTVWASIGLLFVTIAIFFIYELFVKEEAKNANLALSLQRLKLENEHFNEINSIYTDIRAWRHEYNNNLIVLRDLAKQGSKEKMLEYIDSISAEPLNFESSLQTGNFILDSIVSSKLGLAQKYGIEVSIQAVYPKDNSIDDNDLCAIVGNLLDNAIEACGLPSKISEQLESERRYINFEFLVKGKNIVISVQNSYFHEIIQNNGRYISRKNKTFHGIGLSLLDSVVHKYNGHIMRKHENGVFETFIILPLV